ncbi:MAG: phytoene/squalene synthase family protein, partial [Pseudomonadota bacterium]
YASLVLPKRVRAPANALYAFCRVSDDAVDGPDAKADAVDRLRDRLDRAYRGQPLQRPVDRAFTEMVTQTGMPRALPEALLDGLSWDADGRRFETISDVRAYSARVAATVGAMMTVIMGVRDPDTLARACDLGVAMQLTNIARDVGEDASNGRIYLPLAWLREAGIDIDEFLARPMFDDRVAHLVSRLLGEAETLYQRSLGGIGKLPADCRPAIHAARLIYRDIGRVIQSNGHDSITVRAVVSSGRKISLLSRALALSATERCDVEGPALSEVAFIVDAVRNDPAQKVRRKKHVGSPIGGMLELLATVERRERLASSGAGRLE